MENPNVRMRNLNKATILAPILEMFDEVEFAMWKSIKYVDIHTNNVRISPCQ